MDPISRKFQKLGIAHAPGQEGRRERAAPLTLLGEPLGGTPVDFSHGDVDDDAFAPTPGALERFVAGVGEGGSQAYTEYRGAAPLRRVVASRLGDFTGRPIDPEQEVILTPGTQGALFLALGATVAPGDRVAIVRPDYFANRKIVEFLGGEVVPVEMDYLAHIDRTGLDLGQLEEAFRSGVRTFLFSNPNNPTGVVHTPDEIEAIARLATDHGVTVIIDELYARLVYEGVRYTHLRAQDVDPDRIVTILGPSKTESLSGYRLGVAFGAPHLIERMEKLQAIVSLRAAGYAQAVLDVWFAEPEGWMDDRIRKHQAIRDDLLGIFGECEGLRVRTPEAGSYLFPRLPELRMPLHDFVDALRLQAQVIVTPGTEFSPDATSSIRLNFSQNRAAAADAARRIVTLIERYRA